MSKLDDAKLPSLKDKLLAGSQVEEDVKDSESKVVKKSKRGNKYGKSKE